jgi:beta-aspartyl-peptidase (threonine type)
MPDAPSRLIPRLVVHGGTADEVPDPETCGRLREGLAAALAAGWEVLAGGGHALDAVEATVRVLEDDPLFNAGRGAVLTEEGTVELDAAIADGRRRRAGAVAVVTALRHPVTAARAVLEHSPHLLLAGSGAEAFARTHGVERVSPTWFLTDHARDELAGVLARRHGTVGAVAVDVGGDVAAATSTGGLVGKAPGRISDSAVLGGGTWADEHVAVSATGDGESLALALVAHRVALGHRRDGLAAAVADALDAARAASGRGDVGGLIAVTADGRHCLLADTPVLKRGIADGDGVRVAIAVDEALEAVPSPPAHGT